MSLNSVKQYLKKYGVDKNIIELDSSSATVALAAEALGTTEGNIAKTLSFLVDDGAIVIVVAGDAKIDNSKYKQYFHKKAKMIPFDDVLNITGHEVGGVCPFGLNDGVKVYLDKSLKNYNIVYPACGSKNSAIKVTISELEEYTDYPEWIDVCK